MIDIVIPLGEGSEHNNLELRYCLASIAKYLSGYRDIYIIGAEPGFSGNFIHIPAKDHGWNIQDNIRRKINIACNTPEISDNFFFANDDYVFLQKYHVMDTPYYYDGDLTLAWNRKRKKGSYKSVLEETNNALSQMKLKQMNFDIHFPIIYNKKLFLEVMELYPWKTCRWGYAIKSLYCNTLMIEGEYYGDMQIGHPIPLMSEIHNLVKDRIVFAYNEHGANEIMFEYLHTQFPAVSIQKISE